MLFMQEYVSIYPCGGCNPIGALTADIIELAVS